MTATRPLRSPFAAIVTYAARITVGGRRWIVLVAALLVAGFGFGLLAHAVDEPTDEAFAAIATGTLFALVVPLGSLVVGDGVLGAEIRSGTFQLTWLAPVPVRAIVLGRWLAGALLAAATLAVSLALSAVVAGSAVNAGPAAAAGAAAGATYVAVFVLVGAVTSRAALWSLVLIYLVEQLLGAVLSGVAQFSPQWLGRAMLGDLGTGTEDLLRDGVPSGFAALFRLALMTVVCLALATWRLRHYTPSGGRD